MVYNRLLLMLLMVTMCWTKCSSIGLISIQLLFCVAFLKQNIQQCWSILFF